MSIIIPNVMKENKAISITKPFEANIIDVDFPKVNPGEALLKLRYGGICGSDLGTYRGTFSYTSYPRIPGHEFSAEIIEIEDNDYGFKKGMIVTGNPYMNCGKCYACRRGFVNACEHNETLGCQRDGLFSTYATLPIKRLIDGRGIDPKELALVEPFCISYHAVSLPDVKENEKVLIVGAGTIGMFAAIAALEKKAIVYISDISEEKLAIAKKLGCHETILNKSNDFFIEEVKRLTDNQGFDVTIEAVGLPSTFQNVIDAVAFAGRVVIIGVGKKNADFNFSIIQKKELKIYGSRNAYTKDFKETIEKIKTHKLNLKPVITDIYPFDKAKEALIDFDQNALSMLKVMIEF